MVKAFIASSGFSSPLMSKDNSKLTKNAKQRDNPVLLVYIIMFMQQGKSQKPTLTKNKNKFTVASLKQWVK